MEINTITKNKEKRMEIYENSLRDLWENIR